MGRQTSGGAAVTAPGRRSELITAAMEPYRGGAIASAGSSDSNFVGGERAFAQVGALASDGGGKGASGDFDYRREESDGSDGVDVFDEENDYASEADFDYLLAEDEARQGNGFDAFDENNWVEVLSPVPTPWYRSPQARVLLIASGTALSAIVISVVLLMFRETPTGDKPVPAPTTDAGHHTDGHRDQRAATTTATSTGRRHRRHPRSPPRWRGRLRSPGRRCGRGRRRSPRSA